MFNNFLKIFLRTLKKHKVFTLINIIGLAIGMAVCILIYLFVRDEFKYDRYHLHSDRIYRVERYGKFSGKDYHYPNLSVNTGPALAEEYPEIETYVRFKPLWPKIIDRQRNEISERLIAADPQVFDVFSFALEQGNPESALRDPFKVVLTREMAARFLTPDQEPVGQILRIYYRHNYYNFQVTGILEEMPRQSHFRSDILISFSTLKTLIPAEYNDWVSMGTYTYLLLDQAAEPERLVEKFDAFMTKYFAPVAEKIFGEDIFGEDNSLMNLNLRPLEEIYLHANLAQEIDPLGNIDQVYILIAVALVILGIACINFVNLSIAQSLDRTREVSLRKVMGAPRMAPFLQLITEAIIITLLALILALVLVEFLLPVFNAFTEKSLTLFTNNFTRIPLFLLFAVLLGGLAGIYPAYYINSFEPAKVLKSIQRTGSGGFALTLRKILIVLQFTISVIMIIATIFVSRQMEYIVNKDMGFDKSNLVVVNIDNKEVQSKINTIKHQLEQYSTIVSVAASSSPLGEKDYPQPGMVPSGQPGKNITPVNLIDTDDDFIKTMGMEIIAGRGFSENFGSDQNANSIIINEAALRTYHWQSPEEALGKQLVAVEMEMDESNEKTIIGVVRDFNYSTLYDMIQPMAFTINTWNKQVLYVRFTGNDPEPVLAKIKEQLNRFAPGLIFDYAFQQEFFQDLHKKEAQQQQIFQLCAILAIIIACMGLFTLSTYIIKLRTRELGIRKVLGASSFTLWREITIAFQKMVIIAIIVSWPAAYLMMNKWLQNFAYRINISIGPFILSGIMALIIALITVSWQAYKAAKANPVETLKYE